MVKHVALGHSMLDALLQDENLLELKRAKAQSKPKKVAVGSTCPICDNKVIFRGVDNCSGGA